jgi:hypothetical protein
MIGFPKSLELFRISYDKLNGFVSAGRGVIFSATWGIIHSPWLFRGSPEVICPARRSDGSQLSDNVTLALTAPHRREAPGLYSCG